MTVIVSVLKFATLIGSAILAGAAVYYSVRQDMETMRRDITMVSMEVRKLSYDLALHDERFSHATWFGDWNGSGVLHPSMYRSFEQFCSTRDALEDQRIHQRYRTECLERWERFLELNPALTKPNFR